MTSKKFKVFQSHTNVFVEMARTVREEAGEQQQLVEQCIKSHNLPPQVNELLQSLSSGRTRDAAGFEKMGQHLVNVTATGIDAIEKRDKLNRLCLAQEAVIRNFKLK